MMNSIRDLPSIFPLWIIIAMAVYAIYCFFRTWYIFKETMDSGFFTGLYDVYLEDAKAIRKVNEVSGVTEIVGYEPKELKLYHIIWGIIDIPCICLGSCLPFIRKVFTFKIATVTRSLGERK